MRNNILTVIKKEFARFFGDRRLVLTTVILPGLMIYLLYSFMGDGMQSLFASDEEYTPVVYAENLPELFEAMEETLGVDFVESEGKDASIKAVTEGEADLFAAFPEGFDPTKIPEKGEVVPEVKIYYNTTNSNSETAYNAVMGLLSGIENSFAPNIFDINVSDGDYDLASDKDIVGQLFSSLLPMLLMMFMLTGCVAVAPESIAGEKERGTIATLLVTPMKRSELAIGKIISLSVIALLSGLSSALGTMLSLPKFMGAVAEIDTSVYGITEYLLLVAIILSTVLLIVSIVAVISAFSKNVKEAGTAISPLMIIAALVGISSMLVDLSTLNKAFYLIPFFNSVQCMSGIFSFSPDPVAMTVTVISNFVYTVIFGYVLTRMFHSEKIMFNK